MIAWFAAIAALGVFTAIPIKRQLINREGLAFPTGTATAETLRAIHGAPDARGGEGSRQATALGVSALAAAAMTWLRSGKVSWMPWNLPDSFALPVTLAGRALKDWTFALKTEVVLVGAGALVSFRTGWSMLLGGVLTYAVLAPALVERGVVDGGQLQETSSAGRYGRARPSWSGPASPRSRSTGAAWPAPSPA